MTSMRVVMEAFPVNGVYTGKIADHRGCRAFPSVFAMLCITAEAVKQGWHVGLTLVCTVIGSAWGNHTAEPIRRRSLAATSLSTSEVRA